MAPDGGTHPAFALEARLEPRALLAAIADRTTDLMWVVAADDHRLVWWNAALRAYFLRGYGLELRPGLSVGELVPSAQHADRLRSLYRQTLRDGTCKAEYETVALGLVLELHLTLLAADGEPFGISVFGRDVTAQRRTAETLRRSEAFFRALQEASPDLSAVIGRDGRFRFFSAASRAMLGYPPEELLQHAPLSLVHRDDAGRVARALERARSAPDAVERVRYRARHRDGGWRYLEAVVRNALHDPDVDGFLVNTRDVTDQVLLAARLEHVREEEKTRIARDLHDELGQELTGLKLDLLWIEERLEALEPGPHVNALVDRVVAASALAEGMIEEVQRIATDLRPAALDRLGLAAALREEGRRFQLRTGITCRVEIPAPLPELPGSTANALYRIAQEALTNVARHAGAREAVVALELGDGAVTETVEDDGVGLDPARARDAGALGLAGMRERAALEGGELVITRRERGGTRVSASVPLRAAPEARP